MIDADTLLEDCKTLVSDLIEDLRRRCQEDDETRRHVRGEFSRAETAGRTGRSYEEWLEDELARVAVSWVLATVFVRFCEDNGLYETPLLSGPGRRFELARDHRVAWLAEHPQAGDREWLREVFGRYRDILIVAELFADTNPVWEIGPSADGCKQILELWWDKDDEGQLRHDFTDNGLDTRFLGDLYQDLSEHAKKIYALLQTPEFVEEFILDRTLDPAIDSFGLEEVKMVDPTCGSGHFLLGAFDRLLGLWQDREPATPTRQLAERALQAVHGVDLNPYAAAIARFRLLVAALKASGIERLVDAPDFTINIAVGDSLLHGPRAGEMFSAAEQDLPLLRHSYESEDREEAERILQPQQYHAVVGNPPYITVKDPALRDAYREMYETAYGQYHLVAPFIERFFDLARPPRGGDRAGFVGAIVSNGFMKRQFGTKIVEDYLPTKDLTTVVDTSGAYIPGHGTPTVVLFGRNQPPRSDEILAVLGIRGEPGVPLDPANGKVWTSILRNIANPGAEDEYTSSEYLPRHFLAEHPWSLQGGAAPDVLEQLQKYQESSLADVALAIGRTTHTGEDHVFESRAAFFRTRGWAEWSVPLVRGESVRDYTIKSDREILFPYKKETGQPDLPPDPSLRRFLWCFRTSLSSRLNYGETMEERGLEWWEHSMFFPERWLCDLSLSFPAVATHNHFVLNRRGNVFHQSAPMIMLKESVEDDEYVHLLGLMNSSTACFWMKQTFYPKGGDQVGKEGARVASTTWDDRYDHDGTKMLQFPIPRRQTSEYARLLERLALELQDLSPSALVREQIPTPNRLGPARSQLEEVRREMVGLQEELDWECYRHYGLVDEDLTFPSEDLPLVDKGQRAFEIVLARKQAVGEIETSWFERHGSTPITEIPEEWPQGYRALVRRRIELIGSDRQIRLLEKPEHKRRWNWDSWEELEQEALRGWLLDRMEAEQLWDEAELTTTAKLADRLRGDGEFMQVAQLWADDPDVEMAEVVEELATSEAVPYLADLRYGPSGMRRRAEWERVWVKQRAEDAIDARTELPADDPEHLDEEDAELLKKQEVGEIPVPPKYRKSDYADDVTYKMRGRLDVPKERFILYPGTAIGADTSPVIGWAGWDHLQQAQALAAHYTSVRDEVGDPERLKPLLAGLLELVPWLKQWHNDYDETYGQRLGEFFESFVRSEAARIDTTTQDLTELTPVQLDDNGTGL